MNKSIMYLNFLGIFVLGVICFLQWQVNNHQHDVIEQLNGEIGQNRTKITSNEKDLKDKDEQIDDLQNKVSILDENIADAETKFAKLADERDQIAGERDKVVTQLQRWQDAVGLRDAALKTANDNIVALTADPDNTVQKYNDLAKQYNDLMKQFNALKATTQKSGS
jgi:peptidoglycan hydrolase CwlO-like protein